MVEERNITIQDIAQTANVSKSTVSRVLNNTTPVDEKKRRAVLEAVKALDFQPNVHARGLAGGKTMTIGVQTPEIGSFFYDLVIKGIIQAFTGTKYSPIFVTGLYNRENERKTIETLLRRQVDGLIIVGGELTAPDIDEIRARKPILVVGRQIVEMESECIFIDNYEAGYRATKFLIDQGHRHIVHISGIKHQQDAIRRLNGYKQALADSGIEYDEDLHFEGMFDGDSGKAAIELILKKKKKFTAVFAANDRMAFGARLALYRHKIQVPDDVSIIGFDDQVECAYSIPPLTSVRQPSFEMGKAAANAMLKLLCKEKFSLPTLPAEIMVRESTRRID
ncbi:MAG: LacI family DNA-binding transcriptional regulator [Mariniblastus sp.]